MRRIQLKADEVEAPQLDSAREEEGFSCSCDIQALTPIYKGSAQPDGIDEAYPFRAPGLRGQLRIWWRATQHTADRAVLRSQERLLFGDVFDEKRPRASRVSLGLTEMSSRPARKDQLRAETGGGYDYALWVDRGSDEKLYHLDARARLHLSLRKLEGDERITPAHLEGVKKALRTMVLFGAAGSRGRRGMGSLWSSELFGSGFVDAPSLARALADLAPPAATREWPSLAGVRVAWKPGNHRTAGQAVDAALTDFKDLRGMRSLGGRHFSGDHRLREAQEDWLKVRDGRDMFKAFTPALGMPLMYRSSNRHLQGTTSIIPKGDHKDRLPSPVHVRPVPTGSGYAAVLLLLLPWYRGEIEARNRKAGRSNKGDLHRDAVDILARGLQDRGWTVMSTGRQS